MSPYTGTLTEASDYRGFYNSVEFTEVARVGKARRRLKFWKSSLTQWDESFTNQRFRALNQAKFSHLRDQITY